MTLVLLALALLVILIIALFLMALYIVAIFPYGPKTPPFVPSSSKLHAAIVQELGLTQESVMYDLGSGHGGVLLAAHAAEPRARYIGIEKHWFPRMLARCKRWRAAASHVEFRAENFYTTDLRDATHVYTYLFPQPMQTLYPKFQSQLRPGATLISLDFKINDKEPEKIVDLSPYNLRLGKTLYIYRF